MPKGTRTCKVCGKEYVYCKTFRPSGAFRWQDVACSPEHGSIYFERISASRSKKNSVPGEEEQKVVEPDKKEVKESPINMEELNELIDDDCDIDWEDEEEDYYDDDEDIWFDDDEDDWLDDDEDEWFDGEEWNGEETFILVDKQ